ncbi:MAG TPA: hypothetical protein VFT91_05675 [Dehalococcoidia bacterium]|nr:hypothetical protein [Dehalococcoidia bacterium]
MATTGLLIKFHLCSHPKIKGAKKWAEVHWPGVPRVGDEVTIHRATIWVDGVARRVSSVTGKIGSMHWHGNGTHDLHYCEATLW